MKNLRSLRDYFKQRPKISLLADLIMAAFLITISILIFGRRPGAFIGFFAYIMLSNILGTSLAISNTKQSKVK
ncbi:hypothetical protein AB3239_10945 [Bacillus subtilis]|uniref:hypothetical protein n=1 Tax=Bacillus subtilis TaxID=1423 RepID=UPI0035264549